MKKLRKMLYLKFARKFNRNAEALPVPSIISQNTKVTGDIISDGIIHVDGHVEVLKYRDFPGVSSPSILKKRLTN